MDKRGGRPTRAHKNTQQLFMLTLTKQTWWIFGENNTAQKVNLPTILCTEDSIYSPE